MARRRKIRSSISIPITLGAITVLLSLALLVGWSFLLGQKITRSADIAGDVWLLVLGALSFVLIIVVLVLFVISLARGIIEVRKQDTFIDSVTHELKSPLASLQLCLETLGREGLEDDAREKLRRMMLEDVDRLRAFIDDVLEANRLSYARPGCSTSATCRYHNSPSSAPEPFGFGTSSSPRRCPSTSTRRSW